MMPRGARRGGALYPVLIIMGILFMMSALLPQVLVDASVNIRTDRKRDKLMDAVDTAIAFSEARLKRQLASLVVSGQAAEAGKKIVPGTDSLKFYKEGSAPSIPGSAGWVVKPTFDNPDYGHNHDYDFEARCMRVHLFHVNDLLVSQVYQFNYTIDAGAWNKAGNNKHVEVNGVVQIPAAVGPHGERTVSDESVTIQGINREVPTPYVPYGGSPH